MRKNNYNYEELIECGKGNLFGEGNAKLPLPPMLMFDRITKIEENSGEFKKGFIKAELDIKENLWFFDCHFKKDPVMPGCLGLDAMWQLVGFFLGWTGEPGKGRALGVNTVKFTGEVLKTVFSPLPAAASYNYNAGGSVPHTALGLHPQRTAPQTRKIGTTRGV